MLSSSRSSAESAADARIVIANWITLRPKSVDTFAHCSKWLIASMLLDRATDLPDGLFCKLPVQPHLKKYFNSHLTRIKSISLTVLSHRGAFRDRHGRWERDAVDARASGAPWQSQGEMNLVSDQLACKTIGALADGKAVWFWHPLLVLNSWRLVGPTGRRQNLNPRMTVTRRIRRRGEHEISRKTIARGMPGQLGEPVVTMLVCFILFRTRGCGCIGHPAFPAPSVFFGRPVFAKKKLG